MKKYSYTNNNNSIKWQINNNNHTVSLVSEFTGTRDFAISMDYIDVLIQCANVTSIHVRIYDISKQKAFDTVIGMPWPDTFLVGLPVRIKSSDVLKYTGTPIKKWETILSVR